MRFVSGCLALGLLSTAGVMVSGDPSLAAAGAAAPAAEAFTYPTDEAVPGITLIRGDGRIELADCAGLGAGMLRVRSNVRDEEFCFDVKGPGGYLALELRKTYQLRGDGEHQVEAELTVNGVPQEEPLEVPTTTWAYLPVVGGQEGHTLVELRSDDELPSGADGGTSQGAYPFVGRVHVGDAANGGLSCSGALVDQWWVVTARACLSTDGQPVVAGAPRHPTKVTLGRADVSGAGPGVVVSVAQVVPHPDRDVALLRLAAAVNNVAPVQLATSPPVVGDVLKVAGYGRTATAWVPEVSHVASFTVSELTATSVGITGQDPQQVGPCHGDAGGPGLREAGGGVELVALTSTAALGGCRGSAAAEGRGGTQTRLDGLAEWLQQQVSASTVNVLIDESSKMCLAVSGASTESGAHAIQWACSGAADQDWQIKARSGGKFELRNDRSGMCLAVGAGSKENGAHVLQWPCREANQDQGWQLSRDSRGYTELRNSNSGQCLAIEGNSKE
ncbi:MAG TPA: RICIN domain-containing protein, partial [Actinoplanes sp.]